MKGQPFRQGKFSELMVSELNGQWYEHAINKRLFTAISLGRATSLAAAASIGLQLWNSSPLGSGGVNLVLLEVGGMIIVTSATTTAIVLAKGIGQTIAPTSQTAADFVNNNYLTGPSPQGLATALGTFVNVPTAMKLLMHNTAAIAATGEDTGFRVDLKGGIIVPPQCFVAIAAVGAAVAAAGMNMDLTWAELPV